MDFDWYAMLVWVLFSLLFDEEEPYCEDDAGEEGDGADYDAGYCAAGQGR